MKSVTTDKTPMRSDLPEWKQLEKNGPLANGLSLKALFAADPLRYEKFNVAIPGMVLDYSKQPLTDEIMHQLFSLAYACDVEGWRESMFSGEPINLTEGRSVLHTALRRPKSDRVVVQGTNIIPQIHDTLERMRLLSEKIRSEKKFTSIVNIGIGGSDLGPRMACSALRPFIDPDINVMFVSNLDSAHLTDALKHCDAQKTLFIVTSKTFSTQETLTNANSARSWLRKALGREDVSEHFAAVTQNVSSAQDFGVSPDLIFPIWDWVGGRYSLWSAVGLPLCIAIGYEHFTELLEGAHTMDEHFQTAPLEENMPVILALVGLWNRTFLHHPALAILPYEQRLSRFTSYIQQLDMESNGKSVDRAGNALPYQTAPIVFGEPGTNAQHAFFQLLHQGTTIVPAEVIAVIHKPDALEDHHMKLLSHVLGQTKALMDGKNGVDPHRHFEGNRPSTALFLDKLDPYHLGMLIALYEHKIFVQGVLWNVNSFDQWGVELGKQIARDILDYFHDDRNLMRLDSSSAAMIAKMRPQS